jgi:hypothetical protein
LPKLICAHSLALVEERMLILLDVKKLLKLDGVDDAAEDDNDES